MRLTMRYLALALAGLTLAACSHKDKDAPLAFVPADTPYVAANLEPMDDGTRDALLIQANAQLPSKVTQMKMAAEKMAATNPNGAKLLSAFAGQLDGKTVQSFAKSAGISLKGHSALYGLGLAPVMRLELADPKAFDGFVGRMENAYGTKLDVAKIGDQSYRRLLMPDSGSEIILATMDKYAVLAMLPADAAQPLLRQALGLDRPSKSIQESGRLADLAKSKGYNKDFVGLLDLTRALPLAASGKDPLFDALFKAHAKNESAKTGEPVADQAAIPASCQTDAARIAARVPSMSFGYTKLDAKEQDMRLDVSLAGDITKAFSGLKVALPGLGTDGTAPFDMALALPMAQLRTFWSAQADAVAAKPFTCPTLSDMNSSFAKIGPLMQKAAIPPFGDLLGLHIALDTFKPNSSGGMPSFTGRVVIGTNNPAGLLAMGQMMTPALAQMKITNDSKPAALPANLTQMVGQPVWVAMGEKALAFGIGAGEDAKLGGALKQSGGGDGQLMRMHLDGAMYVSWIDMMAQKTSAMVAAAASMPQGEAAAGDVADAQRQQTEAAKSAQMQVASMKSQAEQVKSISSEVHMDNEGLVVTSQTELK